jgi:hypothetical protein
MVAGIWFHGMSLNQKIAACGSSYTDLHTPVGAAAGCDLLILFNQ